MWNTILLYNFSLDQLCRLGKVKGASLSMKSFSWIKANTANFTLNLCALLILRVWIKIKNLGSVGNGKICHYLPKGLPSPSPSTNLSLSFPESAGFGSIFRSPWACAPLRNFPVLPAAAPAEDPVNSLVKTSLPFEETEVFVVNNFTITCSSPLPRIVFSRIRVGLLSCSVDCSLHMSVIWLSCLSSSCKQFASLKLFKYFPGFRLQISVPNDFLYPRMPGKRFTVKNSGVQSVFRQAQSKGNTRWRGIDCLVGKCNASDACRWFHHVILNWGPAVRAKRKQGG